MPDTSLRIQAVHLRQALYELDTAKTTTQRKYARPTKPTFRPTLPGQDNPISLNVTITTELAAWIDDLHAEHPATTPPPTPGAPGHHYAAWLITNSDRVDNDPDLPELCDHINQWIPSIYKTLQVLPPTQQAEPRHTGRTICYRLKQQHITQPGGAEITPNLLRQWAHKGHITCEHNAEGRATYLASEVYAHLKTKNT